MEIEWGDGRCMFMYYTHDMCIVEGMISRQVGKTSVEYVDGTPLGVYIYATKKYKEQRGAQTKGKGW